MNPGTSSPISIQNAGFLQQTWPKSVHYKETPAHRKKNPETGHTPKGPKIKRRNLRQFNN